MRSCSEISGAEALVPAGPGSNLGFEARLKPCPSTNPRCLQQICSAWTGGRDDRPPRARLRAWPTGMDEGGCPHVIDPDLPHAGEGARATLPTLLECGAGA